jgi:homoserine O-acetyltransferase
MEPSQQRFRAGFSYRMAASPVVRLLARLVLVLVASAIRPAGALAFEVREADWIARDFRFHTGEVMPELTVHYRTLGSPQGAPVLVLHGTAGSGASMVAPDFADELFGPGKPLDAATHYLILPDAIGTGGSSRPSNGLRAKFPAYNYDDMVLAQYRLVTEGLAIRHLRLIIGYSMGGMQTWLWAGRYPGFMDGVVPMASLPMPMSGRNWMLRRLLTESIRLDPDWAGGNYTAQPPRMPRHLLAFNLATTGGNQGLLARAPTSSAGDTLIARELAAPFRGDANDVLFQWESSRDYDPTPGLARIEARVLVINSADDERNPTEFGVIEPVLARLPHSRYVLVPGGPATRGHGTAFLSRHFRDELGQWLRTVPRR